MRVRLVGGLAGLRKGFAGMQSNFSEREEEKSPGGGDFV